MASLNEIKSSIENVKGTQKITKAMYLISASKSKTARVRLEKTRYHFNQITRIISEILDESEDLETVYTDDGFSKDAERALYIVLAGDKGQAGGYNHNVVSFLEQSVDKDKSDLWVAGSMGRSIITRRSYAVSGDFTYPVMNPNLFRAREIAELVVSEYLTAKYSGVHLVYTHMESALKHVPTAIKLLPLDKEDFALTDGENGAHEKADFEPNPKAVFEHLVPHYLKGIIYAAFVDSFTSEQHARMFAMDNATKSASDMIAALSLNYNRVRQAKITQEINEIVGGIPAV